MKAWLKRIPEPRNANSIEYTLSSVVWVGIFMFVFKLSARRHINFAMNTSAMVKNISVLTKEELADIPHDGTVAYLLKKLDPAAIADIRTRMVHQLIRKKCFERYRLFGYYLIAIDGSGYLSFKQRHCSQCLTREHKNGTVTYYHPVLEAKLIAENGMALSIETEFIDNTHRSKKKRTKGKKKSTEKQDCELRAFHRLAARLKARFPQLRICLLLDGIYANKGVLEFCTNNAWRHIITFKEGSMPATYQEYTALKKLNTHCAGTFTPGNVAQQYRWVNDINYEGFPINVLECTEVKATEQNKEKTFMWITNFMITSSNYRHLANQGGRLRWKIENEGFNVQKNGGYNLEHPYSEHPVALKNFYLLLQIAHIINQLIECGSLLSEQVRKSFGSIRNMTRRLLESFANTVFDPQEIQAVYTTKFQIRLRSP